MFHVVLFQPEIPPNTGNVIRLCANSGAQLHLIEPLGFDISEKAVRRAGMDYKELADVKTWKGFDECIDALAPHRWFAMTTKGSRFYGDVRYESGDVFVFGPETSGLPASIRDRCDAEHRIRIPMRPGCRSINLSNSVAIVVYEAWRQMGFNGGS